MTFSGLKTRPPFGESFHVTLKKLVDVLFFTFFLISNSTMACDIELFLTRKIKLKNDSFDTKKSIHKHSMYGIFTYMWLNYGKCRKIYHTLSRMVGYTSYTAILRLPDLASETAS